MKEQKTKSIGLEDANTPSNIVHTAGEFFADGSAIDVVRNEFGKFELIHWDGERLQTAPQIEYAGVSYRPTALDPSIARVLRMPRSSKPYGSLKTLLQEASSVFTTYTPLPENFITAATAFSVASWFSPNRQAAPWLSITGRDFAVARQLLRLLGCLCRRTLLLTDFTLSAICSLPLEWGFTFQISQSRPSRDLYRFLNSAQEPRGGVISGGRLFHLFGPVVTYTNSPVAAAGLTSAPVEIPAIPSNEPLPLLSPEAEERIAEEFQAKFLAYLIENHKDVANYEADLSAIDVSLRETARSLITPLHDDADFRALTIGSLKTQHSAARCDQWTEIDVVLIEALLFFLHEGNQEAVYVGELGKAADELMARRGENLKFAAKNVAARLRQLGLATEGRDKRGYRYLLTQAFSRRVHELAAAFDVPSIQDDQPRCTCCEVLAGDKGKDGELGVPNVRNERKEYRQGGLA